MIALALALVLAQAPAPAHVQRLALLVGIDHYAPGSQLGRLLGCVADTRRVRELLVARFEFAPDDIVVLNDEQATHAGIVHAFHDHLIARATEGTEALFWFSGHGSLVPDASGASAAELDDKDSTFLAYDSRADGSDGAFDLSDDELHSLLYALTRKTARVTIVTDSCHSGGGTRDGLTRYRRADEGHRPTDVERIRKTLWPADVPWLDDGDARTVESQRYAHIAACSSRELAQELDLVDESGAQASSGALTFFLTQSLTRAQPGQSLRAIADDASVRLSTRIAGQNMWYEGALARELFGAGFAAQPEGFLARALPTGAVLVQAGGVHGLVEGSVLALRDASGGLVGRARVANAGAASSLASWIDPKPAHPPESALRALEETRPAQQAALELYCPDAALRATLGKSTRLRWLDAPRGDAYRLAREQDGQLALIAPGELRIWKEDAALSPRSESFAADFETRVLLIELRYRALLALAETPGPLRVAGAFRAPTAAESASWLASVQRDVPIKPVDSALSRPVDGPSCAAGAAWRARGTLDAERELALAMLDVVNRSQQPLHVGVLSVSEDRGRALIWPRAGERDHVLGPGETVAVPVNVTASPKWTQARPMRDRYLLIATREYADLEPFENQATLRDAGAKLELPDVLQLALPTHRGPKSARLDGGEWGIAVLDLFVERAR